MCIVMLLVFDIALKQHMSLQQIFLVVSCSAMQLLLVCFIAANVVKGVKYNRIKHTADCIHCVDIFWAVTHMHLVHSLCNHSWGVVVIFIPTPIPTL